MIIFIGCAAECFFDNPGNWIFVSSGTLFVWNTKRFFGASDLCAVYAVLYACTHILYGYLRITLCNGCLSVLSVSKEGCTILNFDRIGSCLWI